MTGKLIVGLPGAIKVKDSESKLPGAAQSPNTDPNKFGQIAIRDPGKSLVSCKTPGVRFITAGSSWT